MKRWILYSIFSGRGIILYGDRPSEDWLLRAVRAHAKAFKHTGEPGDGDKFRLQEIPGHDAVENSRDFTYRAAVSERLVTP